MSTVHIHEGIGSDQTGDGTPTKPFHSILGAFLKNQSTDLNVIIINSNNEQVPATATALKKARKAYDIQLKKNAKVTTPQTATTTAQTTEDSKLEDAKKIIIPETDGNAKKIKILQAINNRDTKVRLFGWVHRLRQQKGLIFIVLRDGTGFLQCVLTGKLVTNSSPSSPSSHKKQQQKTFSNWLYTHRHKPMML